MRKNISGALILMAHIVAPVVASAQNVSPDSVGHAERFVALEVGVRKQYAPKVGMIDNSGKQVMIAALAQVWGSASAGLLALGEVWMMPVGCIDDPRPGFDPRSCSSAGWHLAAGGQRQIGSERSALALFATAFVGAFHAEADRTHPSFGLGLGLVWRRKSGVGMRTDLRYTYVTDAYYRSNVSIAVGPWFH